jgi:hypothetical protein
MKATEVLGSGNRGILWVREATFKSKWTSSNGGMPNDPPCSLLARRYQRRFSAFGGFVLLTNAAMLLDLS